MGSRKYATLISSSVAMEKEDHQKGKNKMARISSSIVLVGDNTTVNRRKGSERGKAKKVTNRNVLKVIQNIEKKCTSSKREQEIVHPHVFSGKFGFVLKLWDNVDVWWQAKLWPGKVCKILLPENKKKSTNLDSGVEGGEVLVSFDAPFDDARYNLCFNVNSGFIFPKGTSHLQQRRTRSGKVLPTLQSGEKNVLHTYTKRS